MSNIPTMDELKNQWGPERYVPALGKLLSFLFDNPDVIPVDVMKELSDNSPDVFELFKAYMMHGLGHGLEEEAQQ